MSLLKDREFYVPFIIIVALFTAIALMALFGLAISTADDAAFAEDLIGIYLDVADEASGPGYVKVKGMCIDNWDMDYNIGDGDVSVVCNVCGTLDCITWHGESYPFSDWTTSTIDDDHLTGPYTEMHPIEARIAKLEAELQRVAAMVYTIHGGSDELYDGPCSVVIGSAALGKQQIDECLANVTIEEEKKWKSN